jgi:hypothetical protein
MFGWEEDKVSQYLYGTGRDRQRAEQRFAKAMLPSQAEQLDQIAQAKVRRSTEIPANAAEGTSVSLESPLEGELTPEKLQDLNLMSPSEFGEYYAGKMKAPELAKRLKQRPDLQIKLKNFVKAQYEVKLGLRSDANVPYPSELMMGGLEKPPSKLDEKPSRFFDALEFYGSLGRAVPGAISGTVRGIREATTDPTLSEEEYSQLTDGERGPEMIAGRRVEDLKKDFSLDMVKEIGGKALEDAKYAVTNMHSRELQDMGYELAAEKANIAYTQNLEETGRHNPEFARYIYEKMQSPSTKHPEDEVYLEDYRKWRGEVEGEVEQLLDKEPMLVQLLARHPEISEGVTQVLTDPTTWISPAAAVGKLQKAPVVGKGIATGMARAQMAIAKSPVAKWGMFAPEARQMDAVAAMRKAAGDLKGAEAADNLSAMQEFARIRRNSPKARKAEEKAFNEAKFSGATDEVARNLAGLAKESALNTEKGSDILRATDEAGLLLPAGTDLAEAQAKYGLEFVELSSYTGSKKLAKEVFGTAEGVVPKGILNSVGVIADPSVLSKFGNVGKAVGNAVNAYQTAWAMARTAGRGAAFAVPNAGSAVFFAGFQGPQYLNPKYMKDALLLSAEFAGKNYGGKLGAKFAAKNANKAIDLGGGVKTTRGELMRVMEDLGYDAAGEVQLANTALKQKAGELGEELMRQSPTARGITGVAKAGTVGLSDTSEFFQHLLFARGALKRTSQMTDPIEMAKYYRSIADATLDYRRIGAFQKEILREVIPFYNFQHAISAYGVHQLATNPRWMMAYDRFAKTWANRNRPSTREEHQPLWMQERNTVGMGPTWGEMQDKHQDGLFAEPGSEEYATMVLNDPIAGVVSGYARMVGLDRLDEDAPVLESVAPWVMAVQYLTGDQKTRDSIGRQLDPLDPQKRMLKTLQNMVELAETHKVAPNEARAQDMQAMRDFNILWYPIRAAMWELDPENMPKPDPSIYYKTVFGFLGKPYTSTTSSRP